MSDFEREEFREYVTDFQERLQVLIVENDFLTFMGTQQIIVCSIKHSEYFIYLWFNLLF